MERHAVSRSRPGKYGPGGVRSGLECRGPAGWDSARRDEDGLGKAWIRLLIDG